MAGFLVSAAHKSSGKTTLSIGLCAALSAQGVVVQPFKKGPDYIDPMWLAQASGRPCFNLDPFLSSPAELQAAFARHSQGCDLALVEGNKGLYDGLALDGSNSNAALAKLLGLPVILVLDARGMTRGIAPLILGYQAFDREIQIAGVILNQLGGSRHESKLRAVIEHYTDVTVLGALAHDPALVLVERHLGLMPSNEADDAGALVQRLGQRVAEQVDLRRVLDLARLADAAQDAQPASVPAEPISPPPGVSGNSAALSAVTPTPGLDVVRIGLVRDQAFGFYYPDDLMALRASGAELVPIDALHDAELPAVDGLLIGGGFPEALMRPLEANVALRTQIREAIESDLPVYAECGGLMYLARTLQWRGQTAEMVGALPGDVVMHDRPVGRGYVRLQATDQAPWPAAAAQVEILGHEFHYSSLENLPPDARFAFRVQRGHGIDGGHDGLLYRNVLACYAHLRTGAGSSWAPGFVDFVRRCKGVMPTAERVFDRTLLVQGRGVVTDAEGCLRNPDDWSEDFVRSRVQAEGLSPEHWELIAFLRACYKAHPVQDRVRAMIQHFRQVWGPLRGNNHHLHSLFPRGGPQKQGNRLAGLLRTKGEHQPSH